MKIYIVPFLYGEKQLPLGEFVVAENEDQAQKLVEEYTPGCKIEFREEPRPVGEAYKSGARVLR